MEAGLNKSRKTVDCLKCSQHTCDGNCLDVCFWLTGDACNMVASPRLIDFSLVRRGISAGQLAIVEPQRRKICQIIRKYIAVGLLKEDVHCERSSTTRTRSTMAQSRSASVLARWQTLHKLYIGVDYGTTSTGNQSIFSRREMPELT